MAQLALSKRKKFILFIAGAIIIFLLGETYKPMQMASITKGCLDEAIDRGNHEGRTHYASQEASVEDVFPSPLQTQHTVKPGENPFRIAQQHGVSTNSLLRANGLKKGDIIKPGNILDIPKKQFAYR